jgi:tetratricopeptide (TPR) repeat protein
VGLLAVSLVSLAWARVRSIRQQAAEAAAQMEADTTRQVKADLAMAAQLRDEGRALARDLGRWEVTLARALAADGRAVARAGDRAALRERAEQSLKRTQEEDARRRLLAQLDRAGQESGLVGRMAFDHARACRTYEAAFRAAGHTPFAGSAQTLAQWINRQPSGDILIEAVEDWAGLESDVTRREWLLAVAQEADPDAARVRLWRSVGLGNPEAVSAAVAGLKLDEQRPTTIELASRALMSLGRGPDAVALLRRGCETHPTSFKLHSALALAATPLPERLAHHTAAVALRRDSPGARMNLGVVYFEMGKLEEAERAYRVAIRLAPDFVLAHYNLAVTLTRLNRHEEVETVLRRAVQLDPDNPEAPRLLASNALDRRQPEAARAILWSSVCGRQPNGWELYTLAITEEALGRLEVALELFQRSSEAPHGKGIDFLVSKVRVLHDLGRYDEADALAYFLLRAPNASGDLLGRLLPGLIGHNRHGPAEACARRLIGLEPGNPRARDYLAHRAAADTPQLRLERALALQDRGRMEEAAGLLEPLLAGGMTDPHLYAALGRWCLDQGRIKEAETLLTRACAADTPPATAFTMLAQAKRKLGKLGEAATALDRADPKAAATRLGRAVLAVARGEPDGIAALKRLEGEKTAFPPDDCEDAALTLANLGQLWHAGNWMGAAARAWPDRPRVQYQFGVLLLQTERYEPAERPLRAFTALSPADPRGFTALGVTLGHLGRFDDALTALKQGQDLDRKSPKWPFPYDRTIAEVRAAQRLHSRLGAVESGKARPSSEAEWLEWTEVCILWLNRPALAARLADDATREVPALTDAAGKKLLFLRAMACARAAAARGDAADRKPPEYAAFRAQALAALRAEMDRCDRVVTADPKVVAASLGRFRGVSELWSLRGKWEALPEGEREGWRQAWGRFDELLKKAGATP